MSITLESLIEENAKLKKDIAKLNVVNLTLDDHNFRLAGRIMRGESKIDELNLKIKELMQEIDTLRNVGVKFTERQLNALHSILNQLEGDEYKWVQEHYDDCEDEDNDTPETILARLEENGAGDCTYADIQHVRAAINKKEKNE